MVLNLAEADVLGGPRVVLTRYTDRDDTGGYYGDEPTRIEEGTHYQVIIGGASIYLMEGSDPVNKSILHEPSMAAKAYQAVSAAHQALPTYTPTPQDFDYSGTTETYTTQGIAGIRLDDLAEVLTTWKSDEEYFLNAGEVELVQRYIIVQLRGLEHAMNRAGINHGNLNGHHILIDPFSLEIYLINNEGTYTNQVATFSKQRTTFYNRFDLSEMLHKFAPDLFPEWNASPRYATHIRRTLLEAERIVSTITPMQKSALTIKFLRTYIFSQLSSKGVTADDTDIDSIITQLLAARQTTHS